MTPRPDHRPTEREFSAIVENLHDCVTGEFEVQDKLLCDTCALIQPRLTLPGKIIYIKVAGSHSHNVALPESDVDLFGVYAAPTPVVLSLTPPPETVDGKGPDYVIHEVGKFCRLLLKGNPTIVETLFTERMVQTNRVWDELKAERERFLSVRAVKQYLGYATGQLKRLKADKGLHTTGGTYNTKWAYHLTRLLHDAIDIMAERTIDPYVTGARRAALLEIRAGAWTQDEVVAHAQNLMALADTALANNTQHLPDEGDKAFLNDWLYRVRQQDWTPSAQNNGHE